MIYDLWTLGIASGTVNATIANGRIMKGFIFKDVWDSGLLRLYADLRKRKQSQYLIEIF